MKRYYHVNNYNISFILYDKMQKYAKNDKKLPSMFFDVFFC